MNSARPLAVVTGASAGIGAAAAAGLSSAGFDLVLGARRLDRLEAVAAPLGASARVLDVADPESVAAFCAGVERCDLLVNNAGFAAGMDRVEATREGDWEAMFATNVLGVLRMTRALLPRLREAGGQILNVGST